MKTTRLMSLIFMFVVGSLFCQSNLDYKDINLKLSFYDSMIYTSADSIRIKITIENNSLSPFEFDLSRDKFDNLIFNISTISGDQLEQADYLTSLIVSERKTFYRTVSILPGEQFSFVQDLRLFKKIPVGIFAVDAQFYPSIDSKNTAKFLKSNRLSLIVHQKGESKITAVDNSISDSIEKVMVDKKLSPDEVIDYILIGKKNREKEKFFLYINLEELYNSNNYQRTLKNMSETDKNKILDQYKNMIWGDVTGEDSDEYIVKIPTDYNIINTEYNKTNAKVTVIQKYEYKKYTEVKKFVYNLVKEEDYWKLVSYTVS